MNRRKAGILVSMLLFAAVVLVVAPFVGIETITLDSVLRPATGGTAADIFWRIRVPRVITAFCAGTALALAGMAFQAMFRNPLATPFTLGVSSGAAFGAALYVVSGIVLSLGPVSGQSLSAFVWAIIAIIIVYGLTRTRRGFSTATMLIAGVAVNFFFSSLILFIQYLSDFTRSFRVIRWLMGGFEIVGLRPVFTFLPFVVIGCVVIFTLGFELNVMTLGDEIAISRGVSVRRVRQALFFAVSLMVGGIVSVCGPIGFIGMMAPHICRLMVGYDHRYLAPATCAFGGAFLVLCDTLARKLIAPAEIPVGVITALLGGPFFLWLLMRRSREGKALGDV